MNTQNIEPIQNIEINQDTEPIQNIEPEQDNIKETDTIQDNVKIIKKVYRRGINRKLTEEEIQKKKIQQRKDINTTYYKNNLEKLRQHNKELYYKRKADKQPKKSGRPKKY